MRLRINVFMAEGENVYLRAFGTFVVKTRAEKMGQDITKGKWLLIPEHKVPTFKPYGDFKNLLK